MNRNTESRFAVNPVALDMPRSQFDFSHSFKFTANVGTVVPFEVIECLPGDSFNITTSKVIRFQTMNKPILDNMYLDTYYFFVPNRLIWDHWKQFCGESNKAWVPTVEYSIPQITAPAGGFGVGSVADYMGVDPLAGGIQISALPFRAYAKICDDWFRSEAVTDPLVIDTSDSNVTGNTTSASDLYCSYGGPLFKACKYHDIFTSAIPAPQSSARPVSITANVKAPVTTRDPMLGIFNAEYPMYMFNMSTGFNAPLKKDESSGENAPHVYNTSLTDGYQNLAPNNLVADLTGIPAFDISALRIGFQIQKFYEKLSFGRRYISIIKTMFGITSPDARLQRSEYLGGNRTRINVTQVTNNSESETTPLGNLGAMSQTADVSQDCMYSCTEHGYLIGVCCVRYDHSYEGLPKHFLRKSMLDYYWPVFANISNQAIDSRQIYIDRSAPNSHHVFAYSEAWVEYRYAENRVAGLMRCNVPKTLSSWHLGDDYDSVPYYSDSWMREDKTNVDRVLAVTSDVSDQYFGDIYIKNTAVRCMPMYSVPGLIDHH